MVGKERYKQMALYCPQGSGTLRQQLLMMQLGALPTSATCCKRRRKRWCWRWRRSPTSSRLTTRLFGLFFTDQLPTRWTTICRSAIPPTSSQLQPSWTQFSGQCWKRQLDNQFREQTKEQDSSACWTCRSTPCPAAASRSCSCAPPSG